MDNNINQNEEEFSAVDMVRSKDAYHLLFKFEMIQKHISFSDGKFNKLFNCILPEEKEKITIHEILSHIKRFPSEKRFNALSKHFDFPGYYDELKAKLLITAFFSGKEKLFKRALHLLGTKDTLALMIELIDDYFINHYSNNHNNLTGNIKILINVIPEEFYHSFNEIIIKCLFDDKQKNINPLFSNDIKISNHTKSIISLNKYFKNIMNNTQFKSLNIVEENNNVFDFLKKYNYFKHDDIHKYDQIRLLSYFLCKHNSPKKFMNKISEDINFNDFFTNQKYAMFEIMFKRIIDYNIEQYNNIKRFHKNIDSLFEIINRLDTNNYLHCIFNLKRHDIVLTDNNIEVEIKNYYHESVIKSLNLHLKEENQINIHSYQTISQEDILEHFKRVLEKETIIETLKEDSKIILNKPKRI